MDKSRRMHPAALALFCISAACVLLLLCSQSSPLYPTNTWVDANCLLTVGRVMKEGGVLYRDIYEQKGPTLYLIHMLAACISDTTFFGVFVMEVLAMAATLYAACCLMMRRLCAGMAMSASVLIAALTVSSGAFMMGDSAEEFCLPFLMGALCIAFCEYGERKGLMQQKRLFVCGLLAGGVATIKFTALGLFVGLCLLEGVLALRESGMARALRSAGVFLAGMLLPLGAWCAYFAAHGALGDAYTAYIHNNIFLYSGEARTVLDILRDVFGAVKDNLPWMMIAAVGLLALLLDGEEPLSLRFGVWAMAACAWAAVFLPGRPFAYYPLVLSVFAFAGVPSLAARLPALVSMHRRAAQAACCALALAAAILLSPNAPLRGIQREELAQARLAAHIPPDATLLQYSHLDDGLYLFADTLPTERFFCRLNVSYPQMDEALDRYLEEGVPDYVLVSWEELPEKFDNYQWVATDAGYDDQNRINKLLHLYRRK